MSNKFNNVPGNNVNVSTVTTVIEVPIEVPGESVSLNNINESILFEEDNEYSIGNHIDNRPDVVNVVKRIVVGSDVINEHNEEDSGAVRAWDIFSGKYNYDPYDYEYNNPTGGGVPPSISLYYYNGVNNDGAKVTIGRARGTQDNFSALENNDLLGRILFAGNMGDGVGAFGDGWASGPSISAKATQNWDFEHRGAKLIFTITPQDSTSGGTREVMYINSDGSLSVVPNNVEILKVDETKATTKNLTVNGQFWSTPVNFTTPSETTANIDWNNGNIQTLNLANASGDVTVEFFNPIYGAEYTLQIMQHQTVPKGLIFANAIKWQNGEVPTISTDLGSVDILKIIRVGDAYYGYLMKNFSY